MYSKLSFVNKDGTYNQKTIVQYTTEILCEYGLKEGNEIQECAGVWIYPKEYFCPLDQTLTLHITSNTRSIHHYDSSWLSPQKRIIKKIKKISRLFFFIKVKKEFRFSSFDKQVI